MRQELMGALVDQEIAAWVSRDHGVVTSDRVVDEVILDDDAGRT